jgi:hypothetical protein
LAAEPGQAGETLRCECGSGVTVPTLRQLRQLPVASESPTEAAHAWEARHGAITVLVLAAVIALIAAGVSWWNQPSVPEFSPAGWTRMMDNRFSELTPVAAWKLWVDAYRPLAANGFDTLKYAGADQIEREIGARRRMQLILLAVAAVCLVAAVATAIAGRSRAVK